MNNTIKTITILFFCLSSYLNCNKTYKMINKNKSLKKLIFNIIVSLRPHQWIKNLILFIPSIAYGNFSLENFYIIFKSFIGFSLVVSSTYILNDLVDIKADQAHPKKI